jgi:hypothetical protein
MKIIKNSKCDRCAKQKTLYVVGRGNYELCWPCVSAWGDGH